MKKTFLLIISLYCYTVFSQNSKELIKELKKDATLQEIKYNLNNFIKINEIAKVDNYNEEISLLNNYNLSDFLPINFFFIGKINDVFSSSLAFFPEALESVDLSNLSKNIENIYSFKNEDKEYYMLKYKDRFLAIEKNELLELIKNLKILEKETNAFKSNLEKSNFKLIIIQEDKTENKENSFGHFEIKLNRSIMMPLISNTSFELKNPFDFANSIKVNEFNFNPQYKDIIDIDGKDLTINKMEYYKDKSNNNKLKAKFSLSIKEIKFFKINYKKLHDNYFKDWEIEYPEDTKIEAFVYYYLNSKKASDLNNMKTDNYWQSIFKDDKNFNEVLDVTYLKFDDLLITSDFYLNNLFAFPKLNFRTYVNEYIDSKSKIGISVLKMFDEYLYSGFIPNEIKYSLVFNLKNEAKSWLIEKTKETKTIQSNKKIISDLIKKYGKKMVDQAMNGNIIIGMPEELLPVPLQSWVIASRDEFPNGFHLYCKFSLNTAKKLLITVKNKKVIRISNW